MNADCSVPESIADYMNDTAPILALTLDAEKRVVLANARARRVIGENVIGRGLRELVVNFTRLPDLNSGEAAGTHLLSLNTAGGDSESFLFRFFPREEGWLALGSLDFNEQIRLRSEVLGLNRDLNNLTRQLHQANAELRELNQLKNQFLGMAAHDLRRPLGVVMMYNEFVLDEASDVLGCEHREFLRKSLDAATDMKRLIDGFLDVAVIESGRLELDLAPSTADEILEGALEIGRVAAGRKGVELIVEPPPDGQRAWVDAPKVQQVLVNLIGNAVEHSEPGRRVWISSKRNGEELVFAVRDEGPGIAPEDMEKLFQPFARAGTRKTACERSIGLGLAIARQVAEAHRGRLWVESTPGEGAAFSLALPIAAEDGTL